MNDTNIVEWLEKVALTRGQTIIKNLVAKGKVGQAEATAERFVAKGAIKTTAQGSQLRTLGGGSEGIATLTAGAKDAPLSARKTFNPRALYSEEQISRRLEAGKELRDDSRFARLHSDEVHRTPAGAPFMHYEYVGKGRSVQRHKEVTGVNLKDEVAKLPHVMPGRYLHDIVGNKGNVRVMPDGSPKVLDYMVAKPKEIADMRANRPVAHTGESAPGTAEMTKFYSRMKMGVGDQAEGSQLAHTKQILSPFGPGSREAKKVRGAVAPSSGDYLAQLRARQSP